MWRSTDDAWKHVTWNYIRGASFMQNSGSIALRSIKIFRQLLAIKYFMGSELYRLKEATLPYRTVSIDEFYIKPFQIAQNQQCENCKRIVNVKFQTFCVKAIAENTSDTLENRIRPCLTRCRLLISFNVRNMNLEEKWIEQTS